MFAAVLGAFLGWVRRRRLVLAAALAAGLISRALQLQRARATDRVVWRRPSTYRAEEEGHPRRRLAEQVARIVARCEMLRCPRYLPPIIAGTSSFANMALFLLKEKVNMTLDRLRGLTPTNSSAGGGKGGGGGGGLPSILNRVYLESDADLSIDFLADDARLPADAPIVVVLPTIGGTGPSHAYYLKAAAARGWRACCFNKRGLAEPLVENANGNVAKGAPERKPRLHHFFNLLGDQDDTDVQMDFLTKRFPNADFIGMAGLSAGSGLLVNYLGSRGARSPVQAGCSLCPAYDVSEAFRMIKPKHPVVDEYIRTALQRTYVERNTKTILDQTPPHEKKRVQRALDQCRRAESLHGLFRAHAPLSGARSYEAYLKRSNPMNWVDGIACPVLLLNADDDMVCLRENIREDIPWNNGGAILVRTAFGSHIAYSDGALGEGNYLVRLSLAFLEAARETGAHAVDVSAWK
jgi:uncharacterized protein